MREIKFRAWATKGNKMVDLKKITPLACDPGLLDYGDGLFIPFREDILLMQYTGIKDKNGVDIYEGDIVKFYTSYYTKGKTSVVEWCEDGMWMPFRDPSYVEDEQGDWFDDKKGFEVIGNIHQNPELL